MSLRPNTWNTPMSITARMTRAAARLRPLSKRKNPSSAALSHRCNGELAVPGSPDIGVASFGMQADAPLPDPGSGGISDVRAYFIACSAVGQDEVQQLLRGQLVLVLLDPCVPRPAGPRSHGIRPSPLRGSGPLDLAVVPPLLLVRRVLLPVRGRHCGVRAVLEAQKKLLVLLGQVVPRAGIEHGRAVHGAEAHVGSDPVRDLVQLVCGKGVRVGEPDCVHRAALERGVGFRRGHRGWGGADELGRTAHPAKGPQTLALEIGHGLRRARPCPCTRTGAGCWTCRDRRSTSRVPLAPRGGRTPRRAPCASRRSWRGAGMAGRAR